MEVSVSNGVKLGENGAAAVSLRNVSQSFRDSQTGHMQHVLQDCNLDLQEGELVAIVGKSGCGKTTILNIVAGLVEPSKGEVVVVGTNPRRARSHTAYMFARDALLPWRRAIKNVTYGLEIRGVPRRKRLQIAREQLQAVGLGDAAGKYPIQLSQGMRQRVALARTWALDAQLILMDEPFAALDVQTRAAAQVEFLRIWEARKTSVLFVTHDLNEAAVVADRIIVLNEGRIQREVIVPFKRPRDMAALRHDASFRKFVVELSDSLGLSI